MAAFSTKLKLWETVRVTTAAQQSFHVILCVTSNLREWHFQLNHSSEFHETDFMQPVSSVYDPPPQGNSFKINSELEKARRFNTLKKKIQNNNTNTVQPHGAYDSLTVQCSPQ
jgi:hypothetical protein